MVRHELPWHLKFFNAGCVCVCVCVWCLSDDKNKNLLVALTQLVDCAKKGEREKKSNALKAKSNCNYKNTSKRTTLAFSFSNQKIVNFVVCVCVFAKKCHTQHKFVGAKVKIIDSLQKQKHLSDGNKCTS